MDNITKHNGHINISRIIIWCVSLFFFIPLSSSAQEKKIQLEDVSVFSNLLFVALLIVIVLLLVLIIVLADVVKATAHYKRERGKSKENLYKTTLLLIVFANISNTLFAQGENLTGSSVVVNSYAGLDAFTFYLMLSIIFFEVFIVWKLYAILRDLLAVSKPESLLLKENKKTSKQPSFIEKINASVAIEQEEEIMFNHSYDGIRELDNDLPPWWKYGFYLTILFGVFYLINYHITGTGKLQSAEYEDQLLQAQKEMEVYRKKAANLVDENNATLLTDENSLGAGKSIFLDNCSACHGRAGEGGVGPNLTDDYWIHKGGIKDVFKIIKYGWPEKGMKSWQQDLGAKQIHEVASYVKSLQGTNPPNAKEKQGELYTEEITIDSTKIITTDTTKIVLK